MKGKILNKTRIAGAVLLATLGVAAGTAQADSVLAPLVIHDTTGANAGTETYFAFKMRGVGEPDSINQSYQPSAIHYYYIQKTTSTGPGANTGVSSIDELGTLRATGGCHVQNNSGVGSSFDVIYQNATVRFGNGNVGSGAYYSGNGSLGAPAPHGANALQNDNSNPNGWDPLAGDFYGMMVIDDTANLPAAGTAGRRDNEGELSGFAYIVNPAQGIVFDYKLINNHLSKASGDFSPGYIAKQSVDWMWLPANNNRFGGVPTTERTTWYSAVVGHGMTGAAERTAGGRWDELVTFTQKDPNVALHGDVLQQTVTIKNGVAASGAYDNDEDVVSGDRDLTVSCLGLYDRTNFLTSLQIPATRNGGWKPAYINAAGDKTEAVAGFGALTYRFDDINGLVNGATRPGVFPINGVADLDLGITMQVETSGNYNAAGKFGSHPNRAY